MGSMGHAGFDGLLDPQRALLAGERARPAKSCVVGSRPNSTA